MAKKLGNDYRLWIESAVAGTYNIVKGQQNLAYSRSSNPIDTSTKDDFPYATTAAGMFNTSVNLTGVADLPDTTGFSRLETQFKAQTATKFQIRKGGATGTDSDKVFEGTCNILSCDVDYSQNDTVKYSIQLGMASAPTTDTLA